MIDYIVVTHPQFDYPLTCYFSNVPDAGQMFLSTCPRTGRYRLFVGAGTVAGELTEQGFSIEDVYKSSPLIQGYVTAACDEEWAADLNARAETALGALDSESQEDAD
jgi:hypothetical protein